MQIAQELSSLDNSTTVRINNLVRVIDAGGVWLCDRKNNPQMIKTDLSHVTKEDLSKEDLICVIKEHLSYTAGDKTKMIGIGIKQGNFSKIINTTIIFLVNKQVSAIQNIIYASLAASCKTNHPRLINAMCVIMNLECLAPEIYARDIVKVYKGIEKFQNSHRRKVNYRPPVMLLQEGKLITI